MIKDKYLEKTKKIVNDLIGTKNTKAFIFGSSLNKKYFGDIDIGVSGEIQDKEIYDLKENFEDSTLPYFVDIINFNKASEQFKNNVFNNKILWIKR